ncbi:phosphatase PAP2 family protein [Sabulilitoribacter multivorans]|uniref:Phosphatase PAP2 family protein n=1 Tax=Flaviramulus multivorans TaxID=1304750 RepID=A0ABS9IHI1_9FLAO|nr:phosphatase PAP2 family protein [Flaviramulus multivorans]MCF7560218.1 phosphatase PAP2 family protein [Flaviramulus multivorans]
MIEKLLEYDTELFLFLNNLGSPTWDNLWLIITNKIYFGPLLGIILFVAIYKKLGWKALLLLILVTAVMITFTDQITNVFKRGFERARPCGEASIVDQLRFIAVRCGKYGFFSGHASNTMAVAIFGGLLLRPYYKRLVYVLVLISFIVAYSRIYVGVHYPLDIVCGLIFGAISGFLFYKLAIYLLKKFANIL